MNKFAMPAAFGAVIAFAASGCATATQQITMGDTNMCLNVVNHGSPEPGAVVNVKPCDPWQNQQWTYNGDGTITGVGGFCIDVKGGQGVNGADVIYTPCSGAPSQKWTPSNGSFVGVGGKCLDVLDGLHVVLNTCNGTPTQRWISR